MLNKRVLFFTIGVLGLISALWLGMTMNFPVVVYFIGLPLVIFPSLTMITLSLDRTSNSIS